MDIQPTLPDGRPQCPAETRKGQCHNAAGYKTQHEGTGFCTWHDGSKGVVQVLDQAGMELNGKKKPKQKPIYDKGLVKGDPKRLLKELSGVSDRESLSLKQELGVARAMLLQLQQTILPPPPDEHGKVGKVYVPENFYADAARLIDVIGKLSERSQPRSTLTVSTVQAVLFKIIDVVAQEVPDQLVLERIINKLSQIVLVAK